MHVVCEATDAGDDVSYTAGSGANVSGMCLPEPTISVLWCLMQCTVVLDLQPYLAKADAWRKESKYSRAAHSSDGSMQIVNRSLKAVVSSPTEFMLWPMLTSTAAD